MTNQPTEYSHGALRITVNEAGHVSGVSFRGDNLMLPASEWGFSLTIDGAESADWQLQSQFTTKLPNGIEVTLEYSSPSVADLRVWQILDLYGDAGRIERWVHVATSPKTPRSMTKATLTMTGLTAGSPEKTGVSVPMARIKPGTPLADIAQRPRVFPSGDKPNDHGDFDLVLSSPDLILGTVTFSRSEPPLHVAVTPFAEDIPATTRLYGAGDGPVVVVEHEFATEVRLNGEGTVTAGEQVMQIQHKDWRGALPAIGKLFGQRGYMPPDDRPSWGSNISVYEADMVHHNGFKGLETRLAEIQAAGFNTIYLMPWHVGCYATLDYLTVAPELGSFDDLKALTSAIHARGMNVLFDLLLVIAMPESNYYRDHPEWFYRNESGEIQPHPVWKAPCLDPASPGFRDFLTAYAVRCCSEWGADGFRVDAPGHRGGNWGSTLEGLQPHEHSAAIFSLLDEIREAIREVKPHAILLAETFGPELVRRCDLVCWQWIFTVDWLVERVLDGSLSGADIQRVIGEQVLAQPPRAWLTFFTVNHDTKAFSGFDREGDGERALRATLALIGAGFLNFGGGWGMRDRPSADEANEFTRLLETKQRLGGLSTSDVAFPPSADNALFIAERIVGGTGERAKGQQAHVRVITNFSNESKGMPEGLGDVIYSRLGSTLGEVAAWDTIVARVS
ncbi:MAG TPA: alpha-amylase family glycosyl hydrolase [Capsulimonadaceae bacterium]|jgi:hypothetical protein